MKYIKIKFMYIYRSGRKEDTSKKKIIKKKEEKDKDKDSIENFDMEIDRIEIDDDIEEGTTIEEIDEEEEEEEKENKRERKKRGGKHLKERDKM